ncbi:MAG: hypothetical protein JXM79_12265 [Sedimentisphaerales bacterium]|nr:hypothetical protein [Sedimentisphaerales bacterium]
MKIKWAFFAVLAVSFFLVRNSTLRAVNTTDIDRIKAKGVLNDQDYRIIDEFLAEAVQELVRTRDLATIAKRRTVIISRKGTQGQYAQRYSEAAYQYIQAGFQEAITLPEERKTNVIVNLLILIDGLEDPRLNDLAVMWLKDQNMVIQYWAVSCLTNPTILTQLTENVGSNPGPARAIAERLKEVVEHSSAEILSRMTRFVTSVNIPQSEELLLLIADERIKRYADWTVKFELYDIGILKLLESKIPLPSSDFGGLPTTTTPRKPDVARRFAQLYSDAVQRYVKGSNAGVLNETQIGHLISVLIEVEEKCLSELLGQPQQGIKRAIERESLTAVLEEHDRLFGNETTPGQLPTKLGFDYGTTADGAKRTSPVPLPDPPQ